MLLLKTQRLLISFRVKAKVCIMPSRPTIIWPQGHYFLPTAPLFPYVSHDGLTVPGTRCRVPTTGYLQLLLPLWHVLRWNVCMACSLTSFRVFFFFLLKRSFSQRNLSWSFSISLPLNYWQSISTLPSSTLSSYSILTEFLPVSPIFKCWFFECVVYYCIPAT